MSRPNNAPRCYGFASAYGADDDICRECPTVNTCGPIAKENLIELSKLIDVGNIGSMHIIAEKKKPKRVVEPTLFKSKTAKVQDAGINAMVERINKCCADVSGAFSAGKNPFSISDKPPYLRPIAALILKGEATDEAIVGVLQGKFNLPEYSAKNLCRITKSSLTNIGAIVECDSKLEIKGT